MTQAEEIFTPGGIPTVTYVTRDEIKYEKALKNGLSTKGYIISVAGPSKSGKTVLINRVVTGELLIPITGAGMKNPEDIWTRTLDWMKVPEATRTELRKRFGGSIDISGKAVAGAIFAKVETSGTAGLEGDITSAKTSEMKRSGMTQVIAEIAGSDYVLFVDDFHYMPREIQEEAARQLKDAAGKGVKICVALVKHRGDDVVRANPELRGRLKVVDFDYWDDRFLDEIATKGFGGMNISIDAESISYLSKECGGSPQLMQAICLETCRYIDVNTAQQNRGEFNITPAQRIEIMRETSAIADFRSLCEVLDSGPRTRGVERKEYKFKDGGTGDVYRCVLKAMAANPPTLSFSYEELIKRLEGLCQDESPAGGSVIGTCQQMDKIAREKFPNERVIDWDDSKSILDISDPYFIFYLRWSNYLQKPAR